MGAICPIKQSRPTTSQKSKITPCLSIQNEEQDLNSIEQQENQSNAQIINSLRNDLNGLDYCLYLIQQIEQIPLSHILKEFSEQRIFLILQIRNPLLQLKNINYNPQEIKEMLEKYLCFVSYVQTYGVQEVLSYENSQKQLISVKTHIEKFNQQFIKFGGILRREMAFHSINIIEKPPERFVKTREWIKKQVVTE